MLKRIGCVLCVTFAAAAAPHSFTGAPQQQTTASADRSPAAGDTSTDEGVPVTSDLVKRKCGTCHRPDEKGRLTRISYRRTTPEGWEQTIKRMMVDDLGFGLALEGLGAYQSWPE